MADPQVAYVWVPGFGAAVARRADARLGDRPLVLLNERGRVLATDTLAARAGVLLEMPERQAVAHCPTAAVAPAARFPIWEAQEALWTQVKHYAARWQPAGLGSVFMQAEGAGPDLLAWCQSLAGIIRQMGWEPAMGATGSKFGATVAGQVAGTNAALLLLPRVQGPFLATQPVQHLPLDADAQIQLQYLGIRTLGQFARLPTAGVLARFGPAGRTAQRWAQGLDDRPIVPPWEAPEVVRRLEFDTPLADRGRLLAALLRSTEYTLAQLRGRFQAVTRLGLAITRADRRVVTAQHTFPLPTSAVEPVRMALDGMLGQVVWHGEGAAEAIVTLAGVCDAPARQLPLFATYTLDLSDGLPQRNSSPVRTRQRDEDGADLRATLDATLQRLAIRYGEDVFRLARLSDVEHPLPERRAGLIPWS